MRSIVVHPTVIISIWAAVTLPRVPAAAVESFSHACDGSAVVDVGDGYFLNATDEDNVIRLYKHGEPKWIREFPFSQFLEPEKNKRGNPKEADIEGVARFGQRLCWIASHGRDRKGDLELSRHRLFCTAQAGRGADTQLEPIGRPFKALIQALEGSKDPIGSSLKAAALLPPDQGGINIEGLGASADGALLIGFRSPLIEGKALVVRLRNPAEVIEKAANPSFDAALLLDLKGNGIRAIEPRSAGASAYWLLAGPVGAGSSQLFEWQVGTDPAPRSDVVLPSESGTGEGLMVDAANRLFVAMDGGEVGAPSCKDRLIDLRSFVVESIIK